MGDRRSGRFSQWLILAAATVLAIFALGEVMVRLVKPRILLDDSPVILATPAMHADRHGAIRFTASTVVRYALATTHGLEFDVRFRINNLGYIDDLDYPLPPATRVIAFVGDSFCVGAEGGEVWVPKLRERTQAAIYNLCMPAAGVAHFESALAGFRETAEIAEIVIVAISDDFYRPLWRPLSGEDGIRMCAPGVSDAQCARQYPFAQAVRIDDSAAALQEAAAEVRRRFAPEPSLLRKLLRHSDLLRFVKRLSLATTLLARRLEFAPSVVALQRIRDRFPGATIRMVHVPDKYESVARRYLLDIAPTLGELRIDYFPVLSRCPLSQEMYFSRDNHPNTIGYRHLAGCVSDYLKLSAVD